MYRLHVPGHPYRHEVQALMPESLKKPLVWKPGDECDQVRDVEHVVPTTRARGKVILIGYVNESFTAYCTLNVLALMTSRLFNTNIHPKRVTIVIFHVLIL